MLEASSVSVAYDNIPVIRELSLTLRSGSMTGLIGPNGAGKSSLMMSMAGQFEPTSGEIRFDGRNIYEQNLEYKRGVGYVAESPFFYPELSATDFLAFVADVKNVPRDESAQQINTLLELSGLGDQRRKATSELSMGMRKKLAIAAALIGQPRILFLDEALNGVDFESTYRIKQTLNELVTAGGIVVVSTHVLDVIEKICNRFVLLKDGVIAADLDEDTIARVAREQGGLERHVINVLEQ